MLETDKTRRENSGVEGKKITGNSSSRKLSVLAFRHFKKLLNGANFALHYFEQVSQAGTCNKRITYGIVFK